MAFGENNFSANVRDKIAVMKVVQDDVPKFRTYGTERSPAESALVQWT